MELLSLTRYRHVALWEMCERLGSQRQAAEQIGVSHCLLNQWVTLKLCFPPRPSHPNWGQRRWNQVKDNLESLTASTIEELWPEDLRAAVKLRILYREREQLVEVPEGFFLEYARQESARLVLPPVEAQAEHQELKEAIATQLAKFSPLYRQILELRFGLNGVGPLSLGDTGKIVGRSRSRVVELEAAAFRKMRQLGITNALYSHLDEKQ